MSAHNLYTAVIKNERGFTFVELEDLNEVFAGNDSLSVLNDEYHDVIRLYDKHSDISHAEIAKVSNDTKGVWFVAQINEESKHIGHEFRNVEELKKALPKLLEGVKGNLIGDKELDVVIYPPYASTLYCRK
ncbi:hypothetical protein [Bacillus bombysepticus]|uniref:hypothetical protein n=1 Tax=Bacillus bombysepticus TaxID=658666 RepID=UPI00301961CF